MTAIETQTISPEITSPINGVEYYRETVGCINRELPLIFPLQTPEGVKIFQREVIEPRGEDGTRKEVDFDITDEVNIYKKEAQDMGAKAGMQFAIVHPELSLQDHIKFAETAELFSFKTALVQAFKKRQELTNTEQGKNEHYVRLAQLPPGDFIRVFNKLASCYMPNIHSRARIASEDAKRNAQNHSNSIPSGTAAEEVLNQQIQKHPKTVESESMPIAA